MYEPKNPRETTEKSLLVQEHLESEQADRVEDCLDIRIPAHEVNEFMDE